MLFSNSKTEVRHPTVRLPPNFMLPSIVFVGFAPAWQPVMGPLRAPNRPMQHSFQAPRRIALAVVMQDDDIHNLADDLTEWAIMEESLAQAQNRLDTWGRGDTWSWAGGASVSSVLDDTARGLEYGKSRVQAKLNAAQTKAAELSRRAAMAESTLASANEAKVQAQRQAEQAIADARAAERQAQHAAEATSLATSRATNAEASAREAAATASKAEARAQAEAEAASLAQQKAAAAFQERDQEARRAAEAVQAAASANQQLNATAERLAQTEEE